MQIYVDKIPEAGLELIEQIEPEEIGLDSNMQGISLTKSIDIKAKVTKAGRGVFVNVALESSVECTCARCLARFQDFFRKQFDVSYEVEPGDVVDVNEDIRQEMIIEYPMKSVCKPDCKGLCPNCGQNLNVAQCECRKDQKTEVREQKTEKSDF